MKFITANEAGTLFKLDTKNTSYVFGVGRSGYLTHYYYGAKCPDMEEFRALDRNFSGISFSPYREGTPLDDSRNLALQECTTNAVGDYRVPSVIVRGADGTDSTDPVFVSARIYAGRPDQPELPHVRNCGEAETLEVTLADPASRVEFILNYTVFPAEDCVVRSMLVRNASGADVVLKRAMSFCVDLPRMDFDLVQTPGVYARERFGYVRNALHPGVQGFGSTRTSSGHDCNPAFALAEHAATEDAGEVYGALLVYSGSFAVSVEADPFGRARAMAGLHPDTFEWTLEPGGEFCTPEAVLTFSRNGLGGMSRNFHDLIREHVISPEWAHADRPVLVNNWEATWMGFTREKLMDIARTAAGLGIEMFVLDDGWFGHRDNDRSSLGDWFVYEEKIGPGGLGALARDINALGLKFGLWFEPEMISEDSELHRAHPDWVLTVPGRARTYGRHQCVLDFGRPEVVEHIYGQIAEILSSVPVAYMKWDMNRQPAEIWSAALPAGRQKEAGHRYVLGVYELHRRLLETFPHLLIEGCSGGGGRFDVGLLYYTPQFWTSDNTDALDRLFIQAGTSLFYPCSAQGAHVSVCPNHGTGRTVPFSTRGNVALAGTFGYELDLSALSGEEREEVCRQIRLYHELHHLISDGDQYRLANPWEADGRTAWEFAAKDASEALAVYVQAKALVAPGARFLRLRGLDPAKKYRLAGTDEVYSGALLMNAGIALPPMWRDGDSVLLHFVAE